jgi:hypothetical protein
MLLIGFMNYIEKGMVNRDENKRGFRTKLEAEVELRRILETNYNVCKTVKPSRVYLSPITGLYYLTSKPTIQEYKK